MYNHEYEFDFSINDLGVSWAGSVDCCQRRGRGWIIKRPSCSATLRTFSVTAGRRAHYWTLPWYRYFNVVLIFTFVCSEALSNLVYSVWNNRTRSGLLLITDQIPRVCGFSQTQPYHCRPRGDRNQLTRDKIVPQNDTGHSKVLIYLLFMCTSIFPSGGACTPAVSLSTNTLPCANGWFEIGSPLALNVRVVQIVATGGCAYMGKKLCML